MLHFTFHTLHCTLYTPHFTLYALHSTVYTLHFTPHTPPSTLYTFTLHHTPHFTLYSPHPILYSPQFTLRTPHSTHFALRTPNFTVYTSHSTLHTLHCTLYPPHSTLYTTLCTLHSTLYTLHSTPCTLHFPLYTLHFTLYTSHFPTHTFYFALYTRHSTIPTPHSTHYIPHSNSTFFTLHSLHSTPFHVPQSTVHWYGNRGKKYKTFNYITCFTKVFYVTFRISDENQTLKNNTQKKWASKWVTKQEEYTSKEKIHQCDSWSLGCACVNQCSEWIVPWLPGRLAQVREAWKTAARAQHKSRSVTPGAYKAQGAWWAD